MTRLDRTLGLGAAVVATTGIWWASTVRTAPYASADAVLRLAWSARAERVEDCRPQREEVLATLPPHMRQTLICEGTTAAYRLEVRRDGTLIDEQTVRGGGLRHDRPLYVFRDIPVPAGEAAINVRFVRIDAPTVAPDRPVEGGASGVRTPSPGLGEIADGAVDADRRRREDDERRRDRGEAVPALLTFDERLRFQPREVMLVTYDPDRRELFIVERPPR